MQNEPQLPPDLIDRLNAGDRSAYDEIFTRLYGRLVWLVSRMLGTYPDVRRQHDPESFVHDAWIDLQTALRKMKLGGPRMEPLLAGKARNALIDLAKKERRRRDHVPLNPGTAALNGSTPDFDPPAGSSCDPGRLEAWTRFHEAVGELPTELREVFEVYFYLYADDEPSQAEIAKRLDMHPRRVSRLIAEARSMLARRLNGLRDFLT